MFCKILTLFLRIFLQIGQKYPNYVVDLHLKSTSAPSMKITPAGVNISCAGVIDLYARKPGQHATIFLVTLLAVNFCLISFLPVQFFETDMGNSALPFYFL